MAASVPHLCVFCDSMSRRLHVADVSGYVIDCQRCGFYAISGQFEREWRERPDRRSLNGVRKRIKPANARGMRIDVETLVETPLNGADLRV